LNKEEVLGGGEIPSRRVGFPGEYFSKEVVAPPVSDILCYRGRGKAPGGFIPGPAFPEPQD